VKRATRNITFNLPVDLIQRAKVHAAQHATSVNSLVREALEKSMASDPARQAAVQRMLERARKGLFKVPPGGIKREEIYDRRVFR
jgi:plasmid stability protein